MTGGIYRVPKHRVSVRVWLGERGEIPVSLFVGERAEQHDGPERPSDLLNGSEAFLTVENEQGRIEFLNRNAISTVACASCAERAEASGDVPDVVLPLSMALEDGRTIEGVARYQLPAARRRLQDLLNEGEPFLRVHRGEEMLLVNKRYIASVSEGPREAAGE